MNPAIGPTLPTPLDQLLYVDMFAETGLEGDLQKIRIGQCQALEQALKLASETIATQPCSTEQSEGHLSAIVSIVDSLGRLVAVGEVINVTSVMWIAPYSSECVIQISQARREQDLTQARFEEAQNNLSAARQLRRNARLMAGRAPHLVWRATVISVLSCWQSLESLN